MDNASKEVAKRLVTAIITETLQLRKKPKIGQVEPLLDHRENEFRYLLYKNYKVIYWINQINNRVEVVDVFDTRQEPKKITRRK
ncbi:MAG: type II toxin-antitoxin system RelE/ParE family toxin [Luteibaculum sp.]